MSDNKTIKNFTAADIEKYWNNKLSPAEMHEMEKAAMDDPFFADALEGYKSSVNSADELSALRLRVEKKLNEAAPVIPLHSRKYSWLKIAAAIIVLAGAGVLVRQLVFETNNKTTISKNQASVTKPDNKTADKNNDVAQQIKPDTANTGTASTQRVTNKPTKTEVARADLNSSFARSANDSLTTNLTVAVTDDKEGNADTLKRADAFANKPVEKKEVIDQKRNVAGNITTASKAVERFDAETEGKRKGLSNNYKQSGLLNNSYNYRVVDADNNPVPFANVMNTRDNVGTYTDVRGYFNLVSSDSILDVQVRSLGFNSENYRLVPSKQPDNLVLKEDATARNQMLFEQRGRVMSNVSRKDSAEVEEPEVGWGNYNTYVENNIKIPGNVRAKNALNEVELSFDVDKTGQPINIKVTKSSQCKECDEEAKRLLKEGPKWKRKGKKYKTTISIAVDQK